LKEIIAFTDYYGRTVVADNGDPIQIYDPVNPQNNIASRYSDADRQTIVEAAEDAADAIAFARRATTKGDAVAQWQAVFGSAFRVP
jgi:hypothetical protein